MANVQDISVGAVVNILSAIVFLLAFALLRLQPLNDRVYFPKWYKKGIRSSPVQSRAFASKFINLDFKAYIRFLNWMPAALRMPEPELINHAGLDSAVYIRIYLLGLKIFVPITALALVVLIPINWTGKGLEKTDVIYDDLDKLSISNVPEGSYRFFAHVALAYIFSFWTCYILYREYKVITDMRLHFISSQNRRPDQYTVLVKNVPPDPDESVSEHVDHFFRVNHPDHYFTLQTVYNANKFAKLVEKKKASSNWLIYYQNKYERMSDERPTTKTGLWGLFGKKIDAIDYYTTEIEKLTKDEAVERDKVINDPKAVVPAAFVSFRSRWGAAVCAQTQQTRNPTIWLTEWAPEPRDVYWDNLAIPYVELTIRRLLMAVALFFLTFFFMIPIAIVQSLANLEKIEKVFPFLKAIIGMDVIKSFIQGFLPGIVLKIFLLFLPSILMKMSKIEGNTSLSSLERKTASKYHLFLLVNVFFVSIIAGTALEQLKTFLNQSPTEIPKTVGVSIPMKATFFMTYIMVDGWAGIAAEIIRIVPLVIFHLKNTFLVKTERDRDQAMDPGCIEFSSSEPRIQLYFLMGLVYAVISPILLPFIVVFFAFSYVVYRHQIINVYDQKYESGATFWPDVHRRILIALVISQVTLFGLLSTKGSKQTVPLLIILPILTIWFHIFCKGRFESAFVKFPLQEAMVKDILERATEPNLNLRAYLQDAYLHPVLKACELDTTAAIIDDEHNDPLVATKRNSKLGTSKTGSYNKSDPGV